MADFSALIAQIEAYVKQNGNNEITGNGLQDILVGIVNALGTVAITALQGDLEDEETARTNADSAINAKIPAEASSSNKLADKAFVTGLTTPLQNAVNAIKGNIDNGYVYAGIATPSDTPVSGKVFYLARQAGTYTNFGGQTLTEGVNILKYNGTAWSQEQLISIADIYKNPLMGYYECDTAGATAAKTVAATGYVLPTTGGSVKIKMANRNSVANATLNINSTGAKPLFYNGQRAGVGNTWDTNEIVEVFYDGTNYQAYNVAGSNGDGVFDISAYNLTNGQPTPYVDLAAALGTNGEHVPQSLQKGGMSVKFIQGTVQSSDNKYIQARCMAQNFTTDVTQWQGVDDEPTAESENLVKSGGVYEEVSRLGGKINRPFFFTSDKKYLGSLNVIKGETTFSISLANACYILMPNNRYNFISNKSATSTDLSAHRLLLDRNNDCDFSLILATASFDESRYIDCGVIWFDGFALRTNVQATFNFVNGDYDFSDCCIKIKREENNTEVSSGTSGGLWWCEEEQNKIRGKQIVEIVVEITKPGTISLLKSKEIGKKKGSAYLRETVEQFTTTKLGWNYFRLSTPFILEYDEYLGIYDNSVDTAKFATIVDEYPANCEWFAPYYVAGDINTPFDRETSAKFLNVGVFTAQSEAMGISKGVSPWYRSGFILANYTSSSLMREGLYYEDSMQNAIRGKKIEYIKFRTPYYGVNRNNIDQNNGHLYIAKNVGDISTFTSRMVESFVFSKKGEFVLRLSQPIELAQDEYLGVDQGFVCGYGVSRGTPYASSDPSVVMPTYYYINDGSFNNARGDLAIYCYTADEISESDKAKAIIGDSKTKYPNLIGKRISFMGDSVTTYEGYVPVSLGTFYPTGNVTSVHQTWWHRIIDDCGMVLGVNEARGGSKITNVAAGGNYVPFCNDDRLDALDDNGAPDIIVILGGINDLVGSGTPSLLGDYPTWGDIANYDLSVFRQAYSYVVQKLVTNYTAKIFCCIPPQVTSRAPFANGGGGYSYDDMKDSIKTICSQFGVDVIDLSGLQGIKYYGGHPNLIDHVHPNAGGQRLIAEYVKDYLNKCVNG